MARAPSPDQQLEFFIDKFTPEIAALARSALAKVRERLPGAHEFVYDNYSALAIGFGPTERVGDANLSVVVYPRWALLYFLQGAALPDPERKLKGSGKVGRHIVLRDLTPFDDPAVRELIDDAIAFGGKIYDPKRQRTIAIKRVAEKQLSRRPAKRAARC